MCLNTYLQYEDDLNNAISWPLGNQLEWVDGVFESTIIYWDFTYNLQRGVVFYYKSKDLVEIRACDFRQCASLSLFHYNIGF